MTLPGNIVQIYRRMSWTRFDGLVTGKDDWKSQRHT